MIIQLHFTIIEIALINLCIGALGWLIGSVMERRRWIRVSKYPEKALFSGNKYYMVTSYDCYKKGVL